MKVRIPRGPLAAAMAWSASQLDPKPTVPARAGLLLEADGDTLTITGVDSNVTTRTVLAADILEPGRIVIPGRLAASVVGTYRSDLVDITMDDQRACLQADRDRFLLTLLPVADYPTVPASPEPDGTVPAAEFAEAVRQAVVAVDPTVAAEPWRGGIQLSADGDRLTVWATDRYRMAERSVPWGGADGVGALVPGRALADAVKGMRQSGDLNLSLTGDTVGMSDTERFTTLTRIDETGRKDPHQFIPDGFTTEAVLPVAALTAAVKRACLVAGDKKPKILLGFGEDDISVRAHGDDTGATAFDTVEGRHEHGDPLQIAFMPANLLDGLTAIGTSEVRIGLTANVRPALLHAVGDDTDYRYLVMPVRL
ncbi:DNA polymerase III subunit beta [Streptomyces niveus]|uniref:DNA polymerase III subunit beta n=1 Tax=Streptomyces niveus TaxID=193462 RepID=UPI00386D7C6F